MNSFQAFVFHTANTKPIKKLVKESRLFRPLVKRFIAGDTLEEAFINVNWLLDKGLYVSLDHLGESKHSEKKALEATKAYLRALERIAQGSYNEHGHRERVNLSIKLTQCGLDIDKAVAEENYRELVKVAAGYDNFVRVDMESSAYVADTIEIVTNVFKDYPNTGTVLQSYLYRSLEDVELMINLGIRVRLVKGAYLEPASVAYTKKSRVDEMYVKEAKLLLKHGNYPAIATQDERIIRELLEFIRVENLAKDSFEFQMLYGIRRDLQESLSKEGYPVRVYVPYGNAWYPYFTRRLAERPANMMFLVKALFRG